MASSAFLVRSMDADLRSSAEERHVSSGASTERRNTREQQRMALVWATKEPAEQLREPNSSHINCAPPRALSHPAPAAAPGTAARPAP